MLLDNECKDCLYNSQLKKVYREQGGGEKFENFKSAVMYLCKNPPANYCAPLLMRDIDRAHRQIYGNSIDYSREKKLFNKKMIELYLELDNEILVSGYPLKEAVKYAMAANYIDFARIADLDEGAVDVVIKAARRAEPDSNALASLRNKLKGAKSLCYLHDNCGEIVLDKLLISTIKRLFPQVKVTSVVRGLPIINDVTADDARETGLDDVAEVVDNGTGVPGTYLKEVKTEILDLLSGSDVIISKGLGNLETLFGEGYNIFYLFTCKCGHIAKHFNAQPMSAVLYEEV